MNILQLNSPKLSSHQLSQLLNQHFDERLIPVYESDKDNPETALFNESNPFTPSPPISPLSDEESDAEEIAPDKITIGDDDDVSEKIEFAYSKVNSSTTFANISNLCVRREFKELRPEFRCCCDQRSGRLFLV